MPDFNEIENQSLDHAGQCAGKYLEDKGTTDVAKLTLPEWYGLLAVIVDNYAVKKMDLESKK